jgi:hypothetical protein
MYICIYLCVYVYICVYTYVCIYVYVYLCVCVCARSRANKCFPADFKSTFCLHSLTCSAGLMFAVALRCVGTYPWTVLEYKQVMRQHANTGNTP